MTLRYSQNVPQLQHYKVLSSPQPLLRERDVEQQWAKYSKLAVILQKLRRSEAERNRKIKCFMFLSRHSRKKEACEEASEDCGGDTPAAAPAAINQMAFLLDILPSNRSRFLSDWTPACLGFFPSPFSVLVSYQSIRVFQFSASAGQNCLAKERTCGWIGMLLGLWAASLAWNCCPPHQCYQPF